MDIVVRTPHGEADVSIGGDDEATLGDVLGVITGQAAPRLALVDGRAVDGSCPLDEAGLLTGSVVTTEPALPVPTSPTDVDVLQIAGHGAGRVVRLGPGQYRMGPGRRVTADELDLAPVDRPTIDLVVESTASAREVTVVPLVPDVELDGEPITAATAWQDEILTVGARAFRLGTSAAPAGVDPTLPDPSRRHDAGTVTFSRPPRRRDPPRRSPVVDALRDAQDTAPWLWERRPQHADAFSLAFGLVPGGGSDEANTNAELALASETGVAIVGSEEFRTSLARTLVVEMATAHGPADVDLVVFTSPERLGDWDWAKWLPHLRIGAPPAISSSEHEIERWAQQVGSRGAQRWASPHLTIAILDGPDLWRRHGSPLQAVLGDLPPEVKVIALCGDPSHAPAICSALISETSAGRARYHSFTREVDVDDVRPSLTETGVAVRIARSLAPLRDVELPSAPVEEPVDAVGLGDLLGGRSADDVLARWTAATPRPTVTIGRRDGEPVEIDATDDVTVVVGPSMKDAFTVAASFVLQQCLESPPDALWVLPLIVTDQRRSDLLWELPHATERHDAATPIDPGRLLARIRAVLADDRGPSRILMIVEDSRLSPASPDDDLLAALVRAGRTTDGLGVLVVTDRRTHADPGLAAAAGGTVIRIERPHGTAGGRRATVAIGDGPPGEPFTPPSGATARGLEVLPLVVGRPLSALERWIEQEQARAGGPPDPALRTTVDALRRAERSNPPPGGGPERMLVPPALPEHVGLDDLFRSSPGDGVPVGIGDDPVTGQLRPRWWQPGQGSVLAFGSRRSGIEQVPTVIVLGLLDRFAPEDVRLVVVEPSASRRRALDAIDGAPVARAAERSDDVAQTLDEIEAELDRVATIATSLHADRPRLVVVVADLALLRRQSGDETLVARIDDVLERAAGADSGVDVIAYAGDLDGAGPFADAASLRVVGASSDHTDLARLGVQDASDLEGVAGRCRWFPDGDLVQLALPDADLESMLTGRSPGDPS